MPGHFPKWKEGRKEGRKECRFDVFFLVQIFKALICCFSSPLCSDLNPDGSGRRRRISERVVTDGRVQKEEIHRRRDHNKSDEIAPDSSERQTGNHARARSRRTNSANRDQDS